MTSRSLAMTTSGMVVLFMRPGTQRRTKPGVVTPHRDLPQETVWLGDVESGLLR